MYTRSSRFLSMHKGREASAGDIANNKTGYNRSRKVLEQRTFTAPSVSDDTLRTGDAAFVYRCN